MSILQSPTPTQTLLKRESQVIEEAEALSARFDAIQQPRTDFEIAHFVLAQHDTPERQWVQAVRELQIKLVNMYGAVLTEREKRAMLAKAYEDLRDTWGEVDRELIEVKAGRLALELRLLEWERLGYLREALALMANIKAIEAGHGGPFTYEELQADEPRYWQLRLARQAYLARRGAIDPGNGDAILQTMTNPGEVRPPLLSEEELHLMLGVEPVPALIAAPANADETALLRKVDHAKLAD